MTMPMLRHPPLPKHHQRTINGFQFIIIVGYNHPRILLIVTIPKGNPYDQPNNT